MSHGVEINTQFRDVEKLLDAFKALGWTIEEKTTIHTYPGDPKESITFDYVARNPSKTGRRYDVGISKSKDDEGYNLTYDPYDSSIEQQIGTGAAKLKIDYGMSIVKDYYQYVEVEEVEDGFIVIADDGI